MKYLLTLNDDNKEQKVYSQAEVDEIKHKHSQELNKEKINTQNVVRKSAVAELYYENGGQKGYFDDFYRANKQQFLETNQENIKNTFEAVKGNKPLYFQNQSTKVKNNPPPSDTKSTETKKPADTTPPPPENKTSEDKPITDINSYIHENFNRVDEEKTRTSNYRNLDKKKS